MGWMDRLRNALRKEQPQTTRIASFGQTVAREFITPDTALRQSAVWAALSYLSRTVAQLPWRTLMESPDGGSVRVTSHPVHRLLTVRPNPELTPFSFKETMVWWAASWGNAVAELERNARGDTIAMHPIHPNRVDFIRDPETNELIYAVSNAEGGTSYLRGKDVFHLRGFGDGPVGINVIAYAAESIGWARATEVFGASYMGQGMAPSGILKMKSKLTPGGKDVLERELADKFGGAKNAHRTLVVDFEADYARLAVDPAMAQLIETRQHQVEEVCRWFGVPPHKVMHLLRSTFSNIEHQSIEVVVDSITPWCMRLEEEANYKLFGLNRLGLYTKLDLKGLLRGDYKSRQEGLQIMRRNGVINTNEWRALEDMNPIGEDGDKYSIEANMTTLDQFGDTPEPVEPAVVTDNQSTSDDNTIVATARRQRRTAGLH